MTCILAGAGGLIASAVFLDNAIKDKLADEQEQAFDQVGVTELTLQIQALDGCEKALSALVTQSQTAMESVQVILDTWATLQGKIQAVITDLDDSEKAIGDIMSLVERATRAFEARERAEMVHGMIGLRINGAGGLECSVGLRPFV